MLDGTMIACIVKKTNWSASEGGVHFPNGIILLAAASRPIPSCPLTFMVPVGHGELSGSQDGRTKYWMNIWVNQTAGSEAIELIESSESARVGSPMGRGALQSCDQ